MNNPADKSKQPRCEHDVWKADYLTLQDKYDELVSYLPKVPTEPYERELAKKCLEFEGKLGQALALLDKLEAALDYCFEFAERHCDMGPPDEEWQSAELTAKLLGIESLIKELKAFKGDV